MVFGEILSYCMVWFGMRAVWYVMVLVWGQYGMGQYGMVFVWGQYGMGKILWSQMANLQCATCTSAKTAISAISGKTLGNRSVLNAPKLHVLCRQENSKMLKIHKKE